MKKLYLIVGFLLSPVALWAADVRPVISREAAKYARAWQRSDFQAIISYLPPRVIQQSGGRAALMLELTEQFSQARTLGAKSLETTIGAPSVPKKVGRWLVSVVPVTAVVHGAHVDLTQQSHVLALSSDQGKQWLFVLLYAVSQADLIDWFPEFRGKVTVSVPPPPKVKIVY
jgi:hypothetical protein